MTELASAFSVSYTFASSRSEHSYASMQERSNSDHSWDMDTMRPAESLGDSTTPSSAPPTKNFQAEAMEVIRQVRDTLSAMLQADGKQFLKSRDAQRYFGVDRNLSWQIFKLLGTHDLLGAAQYIPPRVSMQKLFSAAREKKIAAEIITAAENSFAALETFVEARAGQWSRFESMTTALSHGDEAMQARLQHRKALHKSHAFLWDVELDTSYSALIFGPNDAGSATNDPVYLRAFLGLSRLRPDADTHITTWFKNDFNDGAHRPLNVEAMEQHGTPILPPFSTKALPHLRNETDSAGRVTTSLAGDDVGLSSSVDLVFATVVPGFAKEDIHRFDATFRLFIVRPTRQLYMEFLIHRASFPTSLQPVAKSYGHTSVGVPLEQLENPRWAIPSFDQPIELPPHADLRLEEVPRRREMLEYVCQKRGWSLNDFAVYRLHVEYPMLDTVAIFRVMPATPAPPPAH